ncbi:MAG: hypothetical protein WA361_22005 [Candidatus Acidiferrales bacterium]
MSKRKRIFGTVSIAIAVCAVYLWFFGPQTFFLVNSRKIGRRVPIVNSVPVELQDLSISNVPGKKLSSMGVEFEVPWNDVDEKNSRIVGGWALIRFRSGNSIILCVTSPKGFISAMFRDKIAGPELFRGLYGPDVLRSDYALKNAIYETTPSDITLLTPTNRAAGFHSILVMKALMPPTTDWAIYRIETASLRGFQLGDPIRRPKKMSVELYGEDVGMEFNFDQLESGPTPAITQPELNRIIQTAHAIANAKPVLAVSPG